MIVKIGEVEYLVTEGQAKWVLTNITGKVNTTLEVSKEEAPTASDLKEYMMNTWKEGLK